MAGGEGRSASRLMWVWPQCLRAGRRQQGGGESGQTFLLLGLGSGSLALQLDGHFPLGSCTPAGSGQSLLSPRSGFSLLGFCGDSPSSFTPITLQGTVSSLVSLCPGGFGSLLRQGTLEERKGPSRAEMM